MMSLAGNVLKAIGIANQSIPVVNVESQNRSGLTC